MGPGLILVHSQGKWMQRLTRQQCCLKKALTISWKKSSLKAVSLPIIPGHRLHCPGNWELWASEVHPLYPQGPFLKWQNFRRILQSFMCATVETMLCVCVFFFLKTHVSFCFTVSLGTKYPVHLPIRLAWITCFYCSYKLMQETYN